MMDVAYGTINADTALITNWYGHYNKPETNKSSLL